MNPEPKAKKSSIKAYAFQQKKPLTMKCLDKLKGCQVKFHIDEADMPTAQQPRRIPFHLREQMKQSKGKTATVAACDCCKHSSNQKQKRQKRQKKANEAIKPS
ncbi:hypothetical protein ACF0H5_013391 [Mactra antiquata]